MLRWPQPGGTAMRPTLQFTASTLAMSWNGPRAAVRDEARQLTRRAAAQRGEYVRQRAARKAAHRTVLDLQAKLAKAQVASATAGVGAQDAIAGTGLNLTRTLQSVLIKAGVLLLVIIVTPYAIRLVFY